MDGPAVRLEGVRKAYPGFVFGAVDVEVARGSVLGLVGANGAGKSTLLRILTGLVRADSGRVEVLGRRVPEDERQAKAEVAFVSEDMALYGSASLRWHMDLVRSLDPRWDEAHAARLAAAFGLDPGLRTRGLSRGQAVKAMLLLALSRRPRLLVLDEPTAGLDPVARVEALGAIASGREAGQTVIFSTHRCEDLPGFADEVAFVHAGRLVRRGPVASFLDGRASLEEAFLGEIRQSGARRRVA